MTDTVESALLEARKNEGLSRETVARLLDPPVSAKTVERWEKGVSPIPGHRARELAAIYRVKLSKLKAAA